MGSCKDCVNSIFDETWGEYKCKVRRCVIHILLYSKECSFYEKKSRKDKKQ